MWMMMNTRFNYLMQSIVLIRIIIIALFLLWNKYLGKYQN